MLPGSQKGEILWPGGGGGGETALSLSRTDPWAAPEGSAAYARGCHLNGSAFLAITLMNMHGGCLLPKWKLCWDRS